MYDYERVSGDNGIAGEVLASWWHPREALVWAAQQAGWEGARMLNPPGDDATFRRHWGPDLAGYDAIFRHLRPVVWKMERSAAA